MAGTIRLFAFDLDVALPPALSGCLDADERARASRLAAGEVRRRFVTGRARLRALLASELRCDPARVPLGVDANGKPCLPDGAPAFNLSHCGARALLAIGPAGCSIGVDLEHEQRLHDVDQLARLCLSADELDAWRTLPALWRESRFLRLWVRKEACLKALGLGLRIDPDRFSVGLDPLPAERTVRIDEVRLRVADLELRGAAAAIAVANVARLPVIEPVRTLTGH